MQSNGYLILKNIHLLKYTYAVIDTRTGRERERESERERERERGIYMTSFCVLAQ